METEVDASAYMAELRSEVEQLRKELVNARNASVEAQGGGLLAYMQSLGRDNVAGLTSSISEDVLEAMRSLIENVLGDAGVGGEQFMETSGLKLRELLVWQVGTSAVLPCDEPAPPNSCHVGGLSHASAPLLIKCSSSRATSCASWRRRRSWNGA